MSFGRLEIAHVELYLSLTEESLVILCIVFQTLFIPLESLFVALLRVLDLTQDEVKCGLEMLHILSIRGKVPVFGPSLVLQDLKTSLAQLRSQLVLLLDEVMLCQVAYTKWIAWVRLESSIEVLHRLLSHIKIVDI